MIYGLVSILVSSTRGSVAGNLGIYHLMNYTERDMSAVQPTTDRRSQDISSSTSLSPQKSQRVLACVLCQQRKVKCDRKFPCTSCIKSRAQCTPAAPIPRRRKRRFPERELLERLRKYEDLLRQNNIEFEPLHGESTGVKEAHNVDSNRSEVEQTKARGTNVPSPPTTASYERVYEPMYAVFKRLPHEY